jgi:hypothetical protein
MTTHTNRKEQQAPKIIGMETTYNGHERRHGGHGAKVLVTAIFRYDADEDSDDRHVTDNIQLARLGGVRPQDGAEIHTWLPKENRWCFVGDELDSVLDLAALAGLKKSN